MHELCYLYNPATISLPFHYSSSHHPQRAAKVVERQALLARREPQRRPQRAALARQCYERRALLGGEARRGARRPRTNADGDPAAAADQLGRKFFGVTLRPGDVVDADKDAIERLLRATSVLGDGDRVVESLDPGLDAALFAHADSVTRRFFGDDIYMRGILEFSNV